MSSKLREALEELIANIEMRSSTFGLNVMVDTKTFLDAKSALAEPLRNCDVGTTDEQGERFCAFCDSHTDEVGQHCNDCPIFNMPAEADCLLVWSQMPYEKGETK